MGNDRQAETELQTAAWGIVKKLPALIYYKAVSGKIVAASSQFYKFLGVQETEDVGTESFAAWFREKLPSWAMSDEKVLELEKVYKGVDWFDFEDKKVVFIVEKKPWYNRDEHLQGVVCVALLRKIKTLEGRSLGVNQYRSILNEEFFNGLLMPCLPEVEDIFNELPGIVYQKDLSGHYRMINMMQAQLFKKDYNAIIGKTDYELGAEDQASEWRLNDLQVMKKEKAFVGIEKYSDPNSTFRYVLSVKRPWYTEDNKIGGVVGVSLPYDGEQEKLEKVHTRLIKAEEMVKSNNQFIESFSHDARTPLAGIIGLVGSISHDASLSIEAKKKLAVLQNAIEEYLVFFNNILDSPNDFNFSNAQVSWFSPQTLAQGVVSLYLPTFKSKGIGLYVHMDVETKQRECLGYETLAKRILCNIVSNAVKFTEYGQVELTLSLNTPRRQIQINVRDTGVGIEKERLQEIYEKFSTRGVSRPHMQVGVGLGLYITKRYIDFMGGQIEVESKPGLGTTFTVYLPAMEVRSIKSKEVAKKSAFDSSKYGVFVFPGPVLVVEDTELPGLGLIQLLKKFDRSVEVDFVKTTYEAKMVASQKKYALIFFDIGLPDESGWVLVDYVRQTPMNRTTPMVAVSSYRKDMVPNDQVSKISKFLTKPVLPAQIEALFEEFFNDSTML